MLHHDSSSILSTGELTTCFVQHILHSMGESVERKLLQLGVQALERTTGSRAPKPLRDWILTSYDVDIDDSESGTIDAGAFGNVMKGEWNGLTVAVKRMTGDTPQKAGSFAL
jgi:hypothetical protein